jgi:ABC-2 type transport system permease protein
MNKNQQESSFYPKSRLGIQLFSFMKKEFLHVLRDRRSLLILFGMPIAQLLIFGFALTNEIKNAKIIVMDHAQDETSRQIIDQISASNYFEIEEIIQTPNQMETTFKKGEVKMALIFPNQFGHDLQHQRIANLQIIADASDPNQATTLTNYVTSIIRDYQLASAENQAFPYSIIPEIRMLYNPQLKGAPNFVPGVIALILMLVCVMMTAVSIVREKETGTMEVLLVSPFKPILVIVSKAIPYLLLSLINVGSILLLSTYVLDVPVKGSIILLFAESTLFIITCLTLGIFISIKVQSQQVAMLISFMGMMLPTILFSGFMFPIENMPIVLQDISNIIPAKWFYIIVKSIMIKGLGFGFIWKETLILVGITVFFLAMSLKNFKTRLA